MDWEGYTPLPVRELLMATLDEHPDNRMAYLKAHASTEIEFNETVRLLRALDARPDFLEALPNSTFEEGSFAPGTVIGNWNVRRHLGRGGMGDVYLVNRVSAEFSQFAALKIAHSAVSDRPQRFETERHILASLEHAGIARIIDGGTGPDVRPYLVMEWVDGERLTEYVCSHEMDMSQRLQLFAQICDAVSYAHSKFVLHRDIKPSNILVTRNGQVKLVDFGVSSLLDSPDTDGKHPLTRRYCAPEQLSGEPLSTAADVFALGGVLMDLATIRQSENHARSDHGMEDLSLHFHGDLSIVIEKCLRDTPSDRYQSVSELKADIDHVLQNRPISARPESIVYTARKFVARNTLAAALAGLFIISLFLGLLGTSIQMNRAIASEQTALAAQLELEFEARTLQGYEYGLQALYAAIGKDAERLDPQIIDASMIRLAEDARSDFDGRSMDDAFMLYSMGQVMMFRYKFAEAARFLEPLRSLSLDTEISRTLYFEANSDLAYSWVEIGKTDAAENLIRGLLEQRALHHDEYDLSHLQDAYSLSTITGLEADQDQFLEIGRETLKSWEIGTADTDDMAWLHNQMGSVYFEQGKIDSAIKSFTASFELYRHQPIRSLSDITTATNLAIFQIYFARDGDAPLSYLPDYLGPSLEDLGAPDVYAFIQGLIAEAALLNSDWDLAIRATEDAIPHLRGNRSFRDGWYYNLVLMKVRALVQLGHIEKARLLLDPALEDFDQEADSNGWGMRACSMQVVDGYVSIHERRDPRSEAMFEAGVNACRSASEKGWDNEKVMPRWIEALRSELRAI